MRGVDLDEKRRPQIALDVARGVNHLHFFPPPSMHQDVKSHV